MRGLAASAADSFPAPGKSRRDRIFNRAALGAEFPQEVGVIHNAQLLEQRFKRRIAKRQPVDFHKIVIDVVDDRLLGSNHDASERAEARRFPAEKLHQGMNFSGDMLK